MWEKTPDTGDDPFPRGRFWEDALEYANNLSLGGHSDWRLPNVNEMASLLNAGEPNCASWLSSRGFENVQPDYYWTSTSYASTIGTAWTVNLGYGDIRMIMDYPKDCAGKHAWAVRNGHLRRGAV